jgi:hypothetical protein
MCRILSFFLSFVLCCFPICLIVRPVVISPPSRPPFTLVQFPHPCFPLFLSLHLLLSFLSPLFICPTYRHSFPRIPGAARWISPSMKGVGCHLYVEVSVVFFLINRANFSAPDSSFLMLVVSF